MPFAIMASVSFILMEMRQLFPPEIINNSAENYFIKQSTASKAAGVYGEVTHANISENFTVHQGDTLLSCNQYPKDG